MSADPNAAGPPNASATAGAIVLAVGLPGSGKTTWFHEQGIHALSTDQIRLLLLDDETDQSQQGAVFTTLYYLLRRRLSLKRPVNYVDATNLNFDERRSYFRLAAQYGYELEAIYFDVPLEVCLERNAKRPRQVPLEVMQAFAKKLRPPTYEEGFRRITVVDAEGRARPLSPRATP